MGVEAWSDAYREARDRALGYVGTDLLLLGLSRTDGPAGEVLRELGATPDRVLGVLDDLRWSPAREMTDQLREYPVATPRAEHARGRAEGIAIGLGRQQRQADLLLALAYDRDGVHNAILRRLGIDSASIVRALATRGVTVPAVDPPPPPPSHNIVLTLPDEQHQIVVRALSRASVADQHRFFDQWGGAYWGTNSVPERPGFGFVTATEELGLRDLATTALVDAGYPPPPEDAWERQQEM
jgi:hypothetical protein